MKNIVLYREDGIKTLEFKFQNPEFSYDSSRHWTTIAASGRKITIYGTSFLAYDEDVKYEGIAADFSDYWKTDLSNFYSKGEKVLAVFLENETPVMFFYGNAISLHSDGDLYTFYIDNKIVVLHKMHFLIISKDD